MEPSMLRRHKISFFVYINIRIVLQSPTIMTDLDVVLTASSEYNIGITIYYNALSTSRWKLYNSREPRISIFLRLLE